MEELWWLQWILLVIFAYYYCFLFKSFHVSCSHLWCIHRSSSCFKMGWPIRKDSSFLSKPRKWHRVYLSLYFLQLENGYVVLICNIYWFHSAEPPTDCIVLLFSFDQYSCFQGTILKFWKLFISCFSGVFYEFISNFS